jgi:microcystin-dependent protein
MNLPPVLNQYWTDSSGNPLAGGKIYSYQAGTSTPQATYTDQAGGTPNANPVVLDASGWASMWLDPELSYKFVIKDSSDNTIHTVDNVIGLQEDDAVGPESIQDDAIESQHLSADAVHGQTEDSSPATVDELLTWDSSATNLKKVTLQTLINLITPTGIVSPYTGTSAPSGWVLASGPKSIGNASSGGTERANADTSALFTLLWNSFTNTELVIQDSAGSNTTRGASAAADFAANKRMPLPDLRGRVIACKDDISGSAASRLTSGGSGVAGATLGAAGGADTVTLTEAQIPTHSHRQQVSSGGGGGSGIASFAGTGTTPIDIFTQSIGSGQAHANAQPTYVLNYIIKL